MQLRGILADFNFGQCQHTAQQRDQQIGNGQAAVTHAPLRVDRPEREIADAQRLQREAERRAAAGGVTQVHVEFVERECALRRFDTGITQLDDGALQPRRTALQLQVCLASQAQIGQAVLLGPRLRHKIAQPRQRQRAAVDGVALQSGGGAVPCNTAGETPHAAPVKRGGLHVDQGVIHAPARFEAVTAAREVDRIPKHCAFVPGQSAAPVPATRGAHCIERQTAFQFFTGMQACCIGETQIMELKICRDACGRIANLAADGAGAGQNAAARRRHQRRHARRFGLFQLKPYCAIGKV